MGETLISRLVSFRKRESSNESGARTLSDLTKMSFEHQCVKLRARARVCVCEEEEEEMCLFNIVCRYTNSTM